MKYNKLKGPKLDACGPFMMLMVFLKFMPEKKSLHDECLIGHSAIGKKSLVIVQKLFCFHRDISKGFIPQLFKILIRLYFVLKGLMRFDKTFSDSH